MSWGGVLSKYSQDRNKNVSCCVVVQSVGGFCPGWLYQFMPAREEVRRELGEKSRTGKDEGRECGGLQRSVLRQSRFPCPGQHEEDESADDGK